MMLAILLVGCFWLSDGKASAQGTGCPDANGNGKFCKASATTSGEPSKVLSTLEAFPWVMNSTIVKDLTKNSVVPDPQLVYWWAKISELERPGHNISGEVAPHGDVKADLFFQFSDDLEAKHSQLVIYVDENRTWKSTTDMHHSPVRLPVTEKVDFYPDHWEQTNAQGTFKSSVEGLVEQKQ